MTALPLDGIRVIDLSRVLAGPFATMLLADLGADVVKVEPPAGDETRAWGPPWWGDPTDRRSAYFASVNRNKRSVVIDLRTDDGRATCDRLLAAADLLVHNYRPATARAWAWRPMRCARATRGWWSLRWAASPAPMPIGPPTTCWRRPSPA